MLVSIPNDRSDFISFKVAMYGLAGLSFALLVKVLDIANRDTSLMVASYSLAAAIPLLIAMAMMAEILAKPRYKKFPLSIFVLDCCLAIGKLAFIIGFTAYLWHFDHSVSKTFLVFGAVAFI
ncbi:MAG: hypothetical protein KGL39_60730, partial [Patescibacteria group bacterium]|nr:hypothetical protein [Patescibacteria group bacterium]